MYETCVCSLHAVPVKFARRAMDVCAPSRANMHGEWGRITCSTGAYGARIMRGVRKSFCGRRYIRRLAGMYGV